MSTPRKKLNNYNSPYAKPVQQYPSQSADYISLDMGGLTSPSEGTPGGGYTNTQYFQNSNSKANRGRNFYNNNSGNNYNRSNQNMQQNRFTPRKNNEYQHQKQYTPRKNVYQDRYTPQKNNDSFQNRQQHNSNHAAAASITDYCHPSMTEDPWMELLDRVRALESSKISIKSPTTSDNNENGDAEDSVSSE